MIPTEYPSSLHIAAKTLTPTADSAASRTDHPSLFATALTDKPTLTIVYALQAHVLVTMAQMVAEMDVSSTETFRNITQAFLSNWLQFQVPPVSHVKVTVLNQSLSKLTLRRRVAQATDIVISMLVSGDTKVGDMDLAAICNTIFDDKGHILVDRLQATNDISFSQVMTVTSTNHTPVAVVEGGSKTSPVEGGTTSTGTSNLWAIFSIYIWVAIFVGGIAFLIASFGTMRFIYKRRNAVKEREEHKFQEEEPMSTGPASVVSTVLSRNTDFDSTLDYSVVEKKRSFHRQSRQTLKPLFEDGISRNSETTGGDTGPLGLGPQCVCGCLLERTLSGTLRVPPIVQGLKGSGSHPRLAEAWSESGMEKTSKQKARILSLDKPQYDPLRKEENLEWLRLHFRSLHEIGRMPFNNADLWQLHQYFFSPIAATESKSGIGGTTLETDSDERSSKLPASNEQSPQPEHFNAANLQTRAQDTSPLPADASHRASLGRAISFQMLGDAAAVTALKSCDLSSSCRRRVLDMVSGDDEDSDDFTESSSESNEIEPASKRARNFKPRIAYYPRIREKLESVGLKPTQETLSLLRQLKFVENVLFQGKDVYTDGEVREPDQPTPTDVEMIILDLL